MDSAILDCPPPPPSGKHILHSFSRQEPVRSSFRKHILGPKIRQRARNGQQAQGSALLVSTFINLKYQLQDITPFLSRQNVLSTL